MIKIKSAMLSLHVWSQGGGHFGVIARAAFVFTVLFVIAKHIN